MKNEEFSFSEINWGKYFKSYSQLEMFIGFGNGFLENGKCLHDESDIYYLFKV